MVTAGVMKRLFSSQPYCSGHTKSRDRVARFGGDEFIVLVESDDEGDIEKIIDRIQNKIKSINEKSNKPYKIAIKRRLYTLFARKTSKYHAAPE